MRFFVFILFLLFMSNLTSSYGQIVSIDIDARINHELLLTDIAENVTPVVFEMHPDYKFTGITEVVWADPYYFLRVDTWRNFKFVNSYILQYTTSGRFVREIFNYGRYMAVDTMNQILYFRTEGSPDHSDQSLRAYNFEGKLISKHDSFPGAVNYFPHENFIWTQYSSGFSEDKKSALFIISQFDHNNMKEKIIYQFNDTEGIYAGRIRTPSISFSTFLNDLYISLGVDRIIHKVQGNRLIPSFKINITPNPPVSENYISFFRGFVGSYLFINYRHDSKYKLFIYNTKTKKGVNLTNDDSVKNQGVLDNLYETGHITKLNRLNRAGYFYYIKKAEEMKQLPQGVTDPSHPVVFITKIKD